MPTKTARILGYLPGTFRALPRPNATYAVVDAFGNELQQAENASASLMLAHWPGMADRGAAYLQDLACVAALYGLAPRNATPIPVADEAACPPLAADETVEEFREHLQRYVRTFLDGTTTVQGTMRIVAEALGLHIADAYDDMDCWWARGDDRLISREPSGDGAAEALFGVRAASAAGSDESAARAVGTTDLRHGADLRGGAHLHLAVDGAAPADVDLSAHASDPPAVFAQNVAQAIAAAVPAARASVEGGRLVVASATTGAASSITIADANDDAAPALFGLPRRQYGGSAATAARVTGTRDLSAGVDFTDPGAPRYLRVVVDGAHTFELDCAQAPAHRALAQITAAINAQAGFALASDDGRFLTLASAANGFASSLRFEVAAAQDAFARLLGNAPRAVSGRDAQPARVTGTRDLSAGADLSAGSRLELALDGDPPVTVECAGARRNATTPAEIANAIDAAFGKQVAFEDGRFVTLVSTSAGPASSIVFLAPAGDAAAAIFGIVPRTFTGAPARAAALRGSRDVSPSIDVGGARRLAIALDGAAPREIDLRAAVPFDPATKTRPATPQQICAAIDAALGAPVASTDGRTIALTSPTAGASSRIALSEPETTRVRRFASRAFITDDAATTLFGVPRARDTGKAATRAVLAGSRDLSRGADLSSAAALRVALDGGAFAAVDCAARGARPRAALVSEIVAAVNAVVGPVASTDGRTLTLTSPSAGATSRVELGAGGSALGALFGGAASARGTDAAPVVFRGTADLSGGADLSTADHLKLALDGGTPVEFGCAGPDPAHSSLNQICLRINAALHAGVASNDGKHVIISSPAPGTASRLEIDVPASADATAAILGVTGTRVYRGAAAQPARITSPSLHEPLDLHVTRFVGVSVDGAPVVDVDCAGPAAAATTLDQLVAAMNAAIPGIASRDGNQLILTSPSAGTGSRLAVSDSLKGDARAVVLGAVSAVAAGSAPAAATIAGSVDLTGPVNLAEHGTLRIAVDGGEPFDVDVAGGAPDRTALNEIVAAIDAVVPGIASATSDDRLRLTSPSSGESSAIELVPVRAIEVIEYPPAACPEQHSLRYGERFTLKNAGAVPVAAELTFTAPQGAEGAELISLAEGMRLRVATAIGLGESLRVHAAHVQSANGAAGIAAERVRADGTTAALAPDQIVAAPIGMHAFVPFAGVRHLRAVHDGEALTLDDPLSPSVVRLRALGDVRDVAVRVAQSLSPRTFDVEISHAPPSGAPVVERYAGVTIGAGASAGSLVEHVARDSALARAEEIDKGAVLRLPIGTSRWIFADCEDSRFDGVAFDEAPFAGGTCRAFGIFDASTFARTSPPRTDQTMFAGAGIPPSDRRVTLAVRSLQHQPGAFTVSLPADLPAAFGARFGSGRFATPGGTPETYDGVVFDPPSDPDSIPNRVKSALVTVRLVDRVPIGFEGYVMPFHQPRERFLSLGSASAPAKLYLTEPGVTGFYELTANANGTWGNAIAVTARRAGPARWDLTVGFDGARFENARVTALAGQIVAPGDDPLPALAAQILKPRPVGVLQAKAAGVRADVIRDRADLTAAP